MSINKTGKLSRVRKTSQHGVGGPTIRIKSWRRSLCVVLFTYLVLNHCYFMNLVEAMPVSKTFRIMRSSAIKVHSFPANQIGTGYLSKVQSREDIRLLITNKHVVQYQDSLYADSLILMIPSIDSAFQIIDTLLRTVYLFNDSGDSMFVIPDNELDLIAVVVSVKSISKGANVNWAALPISFSMSLDSLYEGMEIIFYGYPGGRMVNNFAPFLRSGVVSGIDTVKSIVFIDADAFGGSSGSPVYLNLYNGSNLNYYNTTLTLFVGIIAGYIPYGHKVIDSTSNKIKWLQIENTGIAIVMPAQDIEVLAEKAVRKLLEK